MKLKKLTLGILTAILSMGVLAGCGNANDEQEPDPTEEPSDEQDQGENMDEQEPDPTEEPSEQQNQGETEVEEEQNNNNE